MLLIYTNKNVRNLLFKVYIANKKSERHSVTAVLTEERSHFQPMRAAKNDFASLSVLNTAYNHCLPPASAKYGQFRVWSIRYKFFEFVPLV